MSNKAWSVLKEACSFLKLQDKRPNPNCNCQKIITFTPNQNMVEGGSLKSKLKNYLNVLKNLGINF